MEQHSKTSTQEISYINKSFVDDKGNKHGQAVSRNEDSPPKTKRVPKILTPEENQMKWSILKNVLCLSFSFTLLFTSFNSLSNLQSSLHKNLGTISLGVIYVVLCVSAFFLPTLVIKRLKPKWVVCASMLCYSPYFAALYSPSYYTFIPAAVLMGLGAAPLWIAKCTYITKIGEKYGEVVGIDFDVVIVRFFGIFFCFLQSSQVLGNLISSAVLSVGVSNFTRSEEFLEKCGANFCPTFDLGIEEAEAGVSYGNATSLVASVDNAANAHQTKIYVMTSIYLVLALGSALFVAVVVDPLSKYDIELISSPKIMDNLLATLKHMKTPCQILITPLTIWSGVEQGLLGAEYTASFVSCGVGVHMVGYVLICFGVCDAFFSLAFTPLVKYTKRFPLFFLGALINVAMLALMFTWEPHPNDYFVFFLVPTLWGMADAVWQTQINALYGVVFPGKAEAAFSNYRLWESVGFLVAYGMSGALCTEAKLWINVGFLCVGMAGYAAVEVLEAKKQTATHPH